ncbi:MAG TPA: hypothetical protein VFH28_00650, partial [Nitrososphaera sp.]|nr:hypothetical protein [Nitrososphaera sp.]
NIATKTTAVLKSTKSKARGRNIVEEPKPAIVPIISAKSAEMKKSIISSPCTLLVCYAVCIKSTANLRKEKSEILYV